MRYLSSALAGACLACSDDLVLSAADDQQTAVRVLVGWTGQSFCLTRPAVSELSPENAFYADDFPAIQFVGQQANDTDDPITWEFQALGPLGSTTFLGVDSIGAETSMLRALHGARQAGTPIEQIAGYRFAVSGMSSFFWDFDSNQPLNPADSPNYWHLMAAGIQAALTATNSNTYVHVIDFGHTDALNAGLAAGWKASMIQHITELRTLLGNIGPGGGEVPVVLNRLPTREGRPFGPDIQQYAEEIANEMTNVRCLDVDPVCDREELYAVDGLHLNGDGIIELGLIDAAGIAPFLDCYVAPIAGWDFESDGTTVSIIDESRSYQSSIVTYHYDMGGAGSFVGGTTSASAEPEYEYDDPGTYTVTQTITNADGDTDQATANVIVTALAVTADQQSGAYLPQDATECTAFFAGAGTATAVPNALRLFQDASGHPQAVIGLPLVAVSGVPAYRQAVAGWDTLSIVLGADGHAKIINLSNAALPNISSESFRVTFLAVLPAVNPAATRAVLTLGSNILANRVTFFLTASGFARLDSGANTVTDNVDFCDGKVHAITLQVTATTVELYIDQRKLSVTRAATISGELINFGAISGGAAGALLQILWQAEWYLAAAEASDAHILAEHAAFNLPP